MALNEINETTIKKHRLEWIDAMRGFTMILVVAYHVALQGFNEDVKVSSSLPFWVLFRMPLFFFISGFLSYRSKADWSFKGLTQMVGKKTRIQIIPTIVFFFTFVAITAPSNFAETVTANLHSPTKGGYWFTLVLLYMFIAYYIYEFIIQKLRIKSWIPYILLLLVAIVLYETCYLPHNFYWAYGASKANQTGWLYDSSIFQFLLFFHFFVFGNIIHRYWHNVEKLLDCQGIILTIIIIAFLSTGDYLKFHILKGAWANLSHTISRYSMLTLVFFFFRYYQECFTLKRRLGRVLQYIGTRTLDIYLLHFMLIPNIPQIGDFFKTYRNNFIMDTSLSVFLSLIVIGFCLLFSNILRISPFLKKYLFGRT